MSRPARPPQLCAHCGQTRQCSRVILEEAVCQKCQLRFARSPGLCPHCGQLRVLAFYDDQQRPACAACTGHPRVYACDACGREDSPWGRLCGHCALAERATALLSVPGAGIRPELQPVYDALISGPRPQTTLYWFTRSTGPELLAAMARGELDISHATFDALPANRTNNYLRDLLTALGVLPPFHAELERLTPWLAALLTDLPKQHADPLTRFIRWHLLRRLRLQQQAGTLTHGAVAAARTTILATIRFLIWVDQRQLTLATLCQADIDQYLVGHPGSGYAARPFLLWAERDGLTQPVAIPIPRRPSPDFAISDDQRWSQVHTLLHDESIRLYARIAGLFILLYGQPLSRIVRMHSEQVTITGATVNVTFDTFHIELPEPLDQLVTRHLTRRGQASYAAHPGPWLFPGGLPGKHLVTENIRGELVRHGIHPSAARNAAMFALAGAIPTPILADILGLSPATAVRWATLANRNWGQYTAQRRLT